MDECWVITAPSGYQVEAWSDDFQVESCQDTLTARCGDSNCEYQENNSCFFGLKKQEYGYWASWYFWL